MGGAERVLTLVAEEIAASQAFEGVKIFVLSGAPSGTLAHLEREPSVELEYTSARSERGGLIALTRCAARERWGLVLSSHTHLNAWASLARRLGLLRTRRLVARESTQAFQRDFGRWTWLIRAMYALYGAQDRVVCQTRRMASNLSEGTHGRLQSITVVVPNPVRFTFVGDAPVSVSRAARHPKRIVWCGRFVHVKRPLLALDVLRCLLDREDGWQLSMLGDGPLLGVTKSHAESLGLSGSVTFEGFVSDPRDRYAASSVGLLTSLTEGFPNVVLEMLANGVTRVVVTDCAGDLDTLPGVVVAEESADIADRLAASVISSKSADGLRVSSALRSRSPGAFLNAILSEA